MIRAWLAALVALACLACGKGDVVRFGAKSFTEPVIVAAMVKQLVHSRRGLRLQVVECGDTYGCQQALDGGSIDMMLEYSGTGALYAGLDPRSADLTEQLRRAYGSRGMEWRDGLGFDNGYVVVTAAVRASGLRTVADLAEIEAGVKLACPRSYLRRPGDGLAALVARYGLRLRGEPIVIDDAVERAAATLSGRAEVAIMYATDGVLHDGGLAILQDDLAFFPPYEASLLVRQDSLAHFEGLGSELELLTGRIDNAAMQKLDHAVSIEGWKPEDVARRFLVEAGVLDGAEAPTKGRLHLALAVASGDSLDPQRARALLALRRVFPDRPVSVEQVRDPLEAVALGDARLALVGAERFFGGTSKRKVDVEALAVVGVRVVHLLRVDGADLAGRVGIEPAGTGAGAIASAILAASGLEPSARASRDELMDKLERGTIEAALVIAEPGDAWMRAQLERGSPRLHPLAIGGVAGAPYLRAARIAPATYPGQDAAVDTLASQVVIAGTGQRALGGLRGGPAAAMLMENKPLEREERELLADATGVQELPDPVLPTAWTHHAPDPGESERAQVIDTLLNTLVLAFLVWLTVITLRRREGRDARSEG